MRLFVVTLICMLTVTCLGQSTNKHMICKSVDDVFDDVTTTGVARKRNIGPPGKPGLPGIAGARGLPGAKGQAGEVDIDRIEEIVRARVSEETSGLEARVVKMNTKIQNMARSISEIRDLESRVDEMSSKIQNTAQTEPLIPMCDGVVYDGRCFWSDIGSTMDIRPTDGPEMCRKKGGRLADIYSKLNYEVVMRYLRTKLHRRSSIWVLTGMKKIYGDRDAYLSDNTRAPYTKARSSSSSWNRAGRDQTDVYLYVRGSFYTGSDEGMAAGTSTYTSSGALCQSQL